MVVSGVVRVSGMSKSEAESFEGIFVAALALASGVGADSIHVSYSTGDDDDAGRRRLEDAAEVVDVHYAMVVAAGEADGVYETMDALSAAVEATDGAGGGADVVSILHKDLARSAGESGDGGSSLQHGSQASVLASRAAGELNTVSEAELAQQPCNPGRMDHRTATRRRGLYGCLG